MWVLGATELVLWDGLEFSFLAVPIPLNGAFEAFEARLKAVG
jgi:hypothetical protein